MQIHNKLCAVHHSKSSLYNGVTNDAPTHTWKLCKIAELTKLPKDLTSVTHFARKGRNDVGTTCHHNQ